NITGGTADALWQAKDLLVDRFVVMMGDDLYAAKDVAECIKYPWAILVKSSETPSSGAKVVVDESGEVQDIVESGPEGNVGLINAGMYMVDMRFFNYKPVPRFPGSNEIGLPQTIVTALSAVSLHAVSTDFWIQITSPEDLARAEEVLNGSKGKKEE